MRDSHGVGVLPRLAAVSAALNHSKERKSSGGLNGQVPARARRLEAGLSSAAGEREQRSDPRRAVRRVERLGRERLSDAGVSARTCERCQPDQATRPCLTARIALEPRARDVERCCCPVELAAPAVDLSELDQGRDLGRGIVSVACGREVAIEVRFGAIYLVATEQRGAHGEIDPLEDDTLLGRPPRRVQLDERLGVLALRDQRFSAFERRHCLESTSSGVCPEGGRHVTCSLGAWDGVGGLHVLHAGLGGGASMSVGKTGQQD